MQALRKILNLGRKNDFKCVFHCFALLIKNTARIKYLFYYTGCILLNFIKNL